MTGANPSFADLYTPKPITVLREGYGLSAHRSDAIAGLTVAIVVLPISIAIAVAWGAVPAHDACSRTERAQTSRPIYTEPAVL